MKGFAEVGVGEMGDLAPVMCMTPVMCTSLDKTSGRQKAHTSVHLQREALPLELGQER